MSLSSYVKTTHVGPDSSPDEKSQSTQIYLNPNMCEHSATICIRCLPQWREEYRINFDTYGGRKFLSKYPDQQE